MENMERLKSQKFWFNKNVFVTGATGIAGSWLTEELVNLGANVVILVRDWVPNSKLLKSSVFNKVTIVRGCVEDYTILERIINEYEIEYIFHLAAQPLVTIANNSALSTFETNIKGSWNLLEASRRAGKFIKGIIIASSDKAYGEQKILPYDEETPLQGTHPYDVSKSCADLIARAYFVTYNLPIGITRCGNFYGPGDLNFNRIIPGTIRSIYYNEKPIIRSDGNYVRDYIYIKDVANAYLTLAENLHRKEIVGEAFNFSLKNKVKVIDLVNLILKLMGSNLKPKILNQASGEIRNQYLSCQKAEKMLNWKAKYNLEEGLAETILWYKDSFKKKEAK